jgi:hypothetical protein
MTVHCARLAGKVTADVEGFLNSGDDTLLLVGEAGSGKSMFSRWYTKQLLDRLKERLGWSSEQEEGEAWTAVGRAARASIASPAVSGTTAVSHVTLWVPYLVELKEYSAALLKEVLPRWGWGSLSCAHKTWSGVWRRGPGAVTQHAPCEGVIDI